MPIITGAAVGFTERGYLSIRHISASLTYGQWRGRRIKSGSMFYRMDLFLKTAPNKVIIAVCEVAGDRHA